jgi:heptosyltransferase-2
LTTPLLKALARLYPKAELVFCVRPESAPILKSDTWRIITYDKRDSQGGIRGFLKFRAQLAAEKFDLAISPHKSLRSTLLIKAAAPYRIGYKEAALPFLYNATVARNMSLHEVERILSLLAPLNADYKEFADGLYTYKDPVYAEVSGTFMKNAAEGAKIAGINAGSAWATKRWPVEHFAELAKKLHDQGYAIAIFGGPGDSEVNDKLKSMLDFEYFDYANKVDFDKIPTLISHMDVFITNDSAPMHIAVSQNVPVVAIFGATTSTMGFAPWISHYPAPTGHPFAKEGEFNKICELEGLHCRPCGKHGGTTCPEKHFRCMKDLIPNEVFKSVNSLFKE